MHSTFLMISEMPLLQKRRAAFPQLSGAIYCGKVIISLYLKKTGVDEPLSGCGLGAWNHSGSWWHWESFSILLWRETSLTARERFDRGATFVTFSQLFIHSVRDCTKLIGVRRQVESPLPCIIRFRKLSARLHSAPPPDILNYIFITNTTRPRSHTMIKYMNYIWWR